MKRDLCREPEVQEARHCLKEHLHQSNTPKITAFPLGISMTICHVHSFASVPPRNAAFTMVKNFCQLVASGVLFQVSPINHWRRCSSLIPSGPPEHFRQSLRTSQVVSSTSGIYSYTRNGCTSTGIGFPGSGMCRYRATCSAITVAMDTLDGGGGRSIVSLYHPCIWIHTS